MANSQNTAQTPLKVNTPDFGEKIIGKNLIDTVSRVHGEQEEKVDGIMSGNEAPIIVNIGTPRVVKHVPNYKRHR